MPQNQRYFIELAYDGTRYHGWQSQPNAVGVQELVDKALSTVFRTPIETTGAGRTDTGVHARQLFAHFDVEEETIDHRPWAIEKQNNEESHGLATMDYGQKLRSINALLPHDIAAKRLVPVHPDAHARFDATQRSYEYHIHFEKNPFLNNFSWMLRHKPDVDLMKQAAKIIMEYTDFSCFSKSHTQVKTNNCKISRAEWLEQDGKLIFHISADRFLRNMVRAIVGTLMMVGNGEITPEDVREIIESKNRSNAGTSVPACGLYLTEVKYPYPLTP
ncbi:tRNA pseudouridine(38-40) synthase TruA [Mucilaginibacter sp. PPCGB 2223]|uniref:tRNA pseudouridine(38-40) synthase TruA n=1 Tax=Mucilaginibacter sp. PPCGB 2223 TaxID=1886027 RepID=UPI0008240974|nr:tRNA pseudouridine(38-40) synthase TruA [Mucilaginibacter sp. PPCGB 2223]OCX51999.1 tRNA pseudouridine(38-40) synthase TruA [Mucilaginibacter sp. PPCGB 2223]